MLKRPITYEDFNGQEQTETFYFNLTESELLEMEVEYEGGFTRLMMNVIEAEDEKRIFKEFQKLILMSYGQRSEDGKRFVKSEELMEEFKQHAAFNSLFMELGTQDKKAAEFLIGVLPAKMVAEMDMTDPEKAVSQAAKMIADAKGSDGLSGEQ